MELITGFINTFLVIYLIVGFALICYFLHKLFKGNYGKKSLLVLILYITVLSVMPKGFNSLSFGYMLMHYLPYNIVWSVVQYNKKYKQQVIRLNNKTDLFKEHSFKFDSADKEPLVVVMIIGESMRGSTVSPENMPLMHARKNLVFLKNARSSETSTRKAI